MKNILSGLNERQSEAVCATEGFVRIIAGAGSGKTRALAHRYAYLVRAAGIPPSGILCVTFTNKAAGEMKKRVRSLAGEGCDTSLITTYHGFCVRVLRDDIEKLFYPKNFRIIDTGDQKKILEEIYTELELKLDHASFEKLLGLIGKRKADAAYVDILTSRGADDYFKSFPTTDETVVWRYLLRQKKVFALDFDDLINFVFVIFDRYPDVKRKWQEKLCYIQVDEFQDSSERELRLIDTLAEVNRNLFVVGDPDQNIYEWRGAKVGILVDFDKTHENTQTIVMDRNYRSTGHILDCANSLISHNKNRIPKNLWTNETSGDITLHLHAKNEKEEAAMIIRKLRELHGDGNGDGGGNGNGNGGGCAWGDCALLYRSGFLSQFLEQALMNEGIPYELYGSQKFFDRMEIADMTAYLRIVESDDDPALLRIINIPRRSIGRSKVEKLKAVARENGWSLYRALCEYRFFDELRRTGAGELVELIESCRAAKDKTPVSELLNRLTTESGYEQYIREAGNMERLDNLSEFKKIAQESERSYGKLSDDDILPAQFLPLGEFLQQIALMKNDDDTGENRDRVKLMTVHASKGLEFPNVFVVGLTDGIFPSSRTLEERGNAGLEEERRLCFVAITRAMKRLFLTESEGSSPASSKGGGHKTPSRFLRDIGEENYLRVGIISKELLEAMASFESELPDRPTELDVGTRVEHVVFGGGVIVGRDDEKRAYQIRFDKSGQVKPISYDYDFELWKNLLEQPPKELPQISPQESPQISPQELPEEPADEPLPEPIPEPDVEPVIAPPSKPIPEPEPVREPEKTTPKREKPDMSDAENLWKNPDVPKEGWRCTGITDLGEPVGICGMCGHQIIRYVHHMRHDLYPRTLGVGCVCAGKMEGDAEGAREREREFKNRESRRESFVRHARKKSRGGNEYFKTGEEVVTILTDRFKPGMFKAVFRGSFSQSYPTPEEALNEIFEAFELWKK